MSKTPQNEDLITEVLNQDPKYLLKKENDKKLFENKIQSNPKSLFENIQAFIQKGTIRFATALFIFVFGLTLGNLALNNAFENSLNQSSSMASNQISNEKNTTDPQETILANKDEKSMAESLEREIQSSDTSKSESSNFNQTPSSNAISLPFQGAETLVENSSTGEKINFKYDKNTKILYFEGFVTGNDGCSYVENYEVKRNNSNIVFSYKLARRDGICIQVLTDLIIKGDEKIDLSQTELQNFNTLFKIEKDNNLQ